MTDVLVTGMAALDFMFYVEEFPHEPAKFRASYAETAVGGCGANAAIAIARLGGTPHLATRLGRDTIGDLIVKDLEAEGVDLTLTDRSGQRSSCSSILIDARGERQIVNFRGAGLTEDTSIAERAPEVRAVLADSRWAAGAIRSMDLAAKRNVPGVLDAEAPLDEPVLSAPSHLAFSEQGLRSVYPDIDDQDALGLISTRFDNWACVTRGANGALAKGGHNAPGFSVQVVDTTGAGDVWHGAFVLSLAEGADEKQSMRFANAAAALKCTKTGGGRGAPTRSEVDEFLERQTS